MERLPQEIFQQAINEIVSKEGLWNSLILRRVSHTWNQSILRAICIEGILDPLSDYGDRGGARSWQAPENSYHQCFPHMLQRPPHWHMVPILETLAMSPTRCSINAAALAIRRAVDWIEQNFREEFPNRDVNTRLLSEIITIMDKDLWLWNLFKKAGRKPSELSEKDAEMDVRRSVDLVMGLAVYTDRIQLYRNIQGRIKGYENSIIATGIVAAYRGNGEMLREILDIAKGTETKFVHLGNSSTGYIDALHWTEILKPLMTYNVGSIHVGQAAMRQLAIAGYAEILRQVFEERPDFKYFTPSIIEAARLTRDIETFKIIWGALGGGPHSAGLKRLVFQNTAPAATIFGDTGIVAYMLSQDLVFEEPVMRQIGAPGGGTIGLLPTEALMATAVKYGRTNIVKILLDYGVRPATSGPHVRKDLEDATTFA
ncbi:hypothetical protein TWF481_004501 [Arthrobotrys musiformis]|uniref:F-box domain-containing protein n=1 Tax=Arthrobotrys musiformis TaxID=47236 RepID=A0AAV9WJR6_9PEZI